MTSDLLPSQLLSAYLANETESITPLKTLATLTPQQYQNSETLAHELVEAIRNTGSASWRPSDSFDALLAEYNLASEEGIALMCLAEALLRIPDHATAQALIEDKLGSGNWQSHLGQSDSFWVNTSTRGLVLSGKFFASPETDQPAATLRNLAHRIGDPVAEKALRKAMSVIGEHFVAGETLATAMANQRSQKQAGYLHSFDMLGEAALCKADADRYTQDYAEAIEYLARDHSERDREDKNRKAKTDNGESLNLTQRDSISIKLSSLHPRYELHQHHRVFGELLPRLHELCQQARTLGVPVTIDAEESYRLELSLELFAALLNDPALAGWPGIGLAVQAYQKRAPQVIAWLYEQARHHQVRIPVRLVKGAYWDGEIKYAQQRGLVDYPVWTRKNHTDISYLACARQLFKSADWLYPQFATHNAQTVASVLTYAKEYPDANFEFQRLHGMGDALYAYLQRQDATLNNDASLKNDSSLKNNVSLKNRAPVRIYAPVGERSELLAYLVRRLLENGANSSFVNAVNSDQCDIEQLCRHPVLVAEEQEETVITPIPLPVELYGPERKNSQGINLDGKQEWEQLRTQITPFLDKPLDRHWIARANANRTREESTTVAARAIYNPANTTQIIGHCIDSDSSTCQAAIDKASEAYPAWNQQTPKQRASCLLRAAQLFEDHRCELMALLILEAGKTYENAMNEVREAVDFCHYYSQQCLDKLAIPSQMDGPTGEHNTLHWQGRGVFLCISPWNFPLAIFVGQIAAALVAGNSVIAKPASATPLVAAHAVDILQQAGIPDEVLQFLPATSKTLNQSLLADPRITGLAFTGSTAAAQTISRQLHQRDAPLPTIIAETGGQNTMLVDSSALPEQVVRDALHSAFDSSGQRCSALRVLFVQEEIADRITELMLGAMQELRIGDPVNPATDIGPLIDETARKQLDAHIKEHTEQDHLIGETPIPEDRSEIQHGHFIAPTLIKLNSLDELREEHFGPVLHLISYRTDQLDEVVNSINRCGYGLTLGIHSRIGKRVDYLVNRLKVGNIYVNRDMIGATVGCQPFGGTGLSGTGPKAGGPNYLQGFSTEVAVSINSAAIGGNIALLGGNSRQD